MASKVEKQLVADYLLGLKAEYDEKGIAISDRYASLKQFKLPSNTTVVCLSCLSIRHKKTGVKCCEKAPNYDLTSSYRVILEHIEKESEINGKERAKAKE